MVRTYVDRLREELASVRGGVDELIADSAIENVDLNEPGAEGIFVGFPVHAWSRGTPAITARRMTLLDVYRAWHERFMLVFRSATPELRMKITEAHEILEPWIQGTGGHTVPASIEEARTEARAHFDAFAEALQVADCLGEAGVVLIPDSNALIRNPDLGSYAAATDGLSSTLLLVPTVVGEIDRHKTHGRPELREAAQAVVRRLKGLRDKGSLADGVRVTRLVDVRALAREPDAKSIVSWLDPNVADDRILASALELQCANPRSSVILVTGDLNLQNKADAVGLPYREIPPRPQDLRAHLAAALRTEGDALIVTLENSGPAAARDITFAVTEGNADLTQKFTAGPWSFDRLNRGQSTEQRVFGFYSEPVVVATWSDDSGPRSATLSL